MSDSVWNLGGQIYLKSWSTSLSLLLWNSPLEMPWLTSPGPIMWGWVHSVGCPYFAGALETAFSGIKTLSNPENFCCPYFWEKCASGFHVIRAGHLILAALNPIIVYLHPHVARFDLKIHSVKRQCEWNVITIFHISPCMPTKSNP